MGTHDDMNVSACMARYDDEREKILGWIRRGEVSVSLSNIEWYPTPSRDLLEDTMGLAVIENNLRWDGEKMIDRPAWLEEFRAWRATC